MSMRLSEHIAVATSFRGRTCSYCGKKVPRGKQVFEFGKGNYKSNYCPRCLQRVADEIDVVLRVLEISGHVKLALVSDEEEDEPRGAEAEA